jgi:hypothetical protein
VVSRIMLCLGNPRFCKTSFSRICVSN